MFFFKQVQKKWLSASPIKAILVIACLGTCLYSTLKVVYRQKAVENRNVSQNTNQQWLLTFNPELAQKKTIPAFPSFTGLGDKVLDVIGAFTLSKALNISLTLNWMPFHHVASSEPQEYSLEYFTFPSAIQKKYTDIPSNETYLHYHRGSSLNPHTIEKLLSIVSYKFPTIYAHTFSVQQIAEIFLNTAHQISFTENINQRIPKEIGTAIGLHLRKSDKVNPNIQVNYSSCLENSFQEFELYTQRLKSFLKELVVDKKEKVFFICSEDTLWKKHFSNLLESWGAKVLELHYFDTSKKSGDIILDFAALSQTKMIIQGVKYSSFSTAASIIGDKPLVTLSSFKNDPISLLHLWRPYLNMISIDLVNWVTENKFFYQAEWMKKNPPPFDFLDGYHPSALLINSFLYYLNQ